MGGMVMAGLAVCGGAGSGQKTRGKGGEMVKIGCGFEGKMKALVRYELICEEGRKMRAGLLLSRLQGEEEATENPTKTGGGGCP